MCVEKRNVNVCCKLHRLMGPPINKTQINAISTLSNLIVELSLCTAWHENYTGNNDRCYCVPETHTDQYHHSYFPRTIVEWNHLDDTIVHQKSVDSFKSALAKSHEPIVPANCAPYRRTYASKWLISDVLIQVQIQTCCT